MDRKSQRRKSIIPTPTEAILESISDGVFAVDHDWRITSFNRAAEEITGIPKDEAIGCLCSEVFRSSMCETECALRATMKSGQKIVNKSGYIINAEGNRIPISVSTAVLRNEEGEIIGGAETFRDLSELDSLRRELEGRYRLGELTSHSPLMQKIFEVLPVIASSPSTVLILGETGTGKEVIARTVHALSDRHDKAFIAVNCGALPDTLLESELFGYKAGAFTGAVKDKPGRFAIAQNGTIFLDEIAEMSPALQVRLLRVLQERTYEPLGAVHQETTNARVIVATNKDLKELTKTGAFREDLYYRVNVIRVELPPLRSRKQDIPILVDQFILQFNRRYSKSIVGLTNDATYLLMAHEWPGNIRELENTIERAFILCSDPYIDSHHLPDELTLAATFPTAASTMREVRNLMEAQAIRTALRRNNNNRLAAARELGIHKSTFFRRLKKLGITAPKSSQGG